MATLTYKYSPDTYIDRRTGKLKAYFRPYIPIRLSWGHKLGKVAVNCLLDSGADRNLFPSNWGASLGIIIKNGTISDHMGIGESGIRAYTHKVNLYIGAYKIITEVDFSDYQKTPLLGRDGFFNFFKLIKIDQQNKEIVLEH